MSIKSAILKKQIGIEKTIRSTKGNFLKKRAASKKEVMMLESELAKARKTSLSKSEQAILARKKKAGKFGMFVKEKVAPQLKTSAKRGFVTGGKLIVQGFKNAAAQQQFEAEKQRKARSMGKGKNLSQAFEDFNKDFDKNFGFQ